MKIDALVAVEAGCLRLISPDNEKPNRFFFYEIYDDKAAVDVHKRRAALQGWSDFKESGAPLADVDEGVGARRLGDPGEGQ